MLVTYFSIIETTATIRRLIEGPPGSYVLFFCLNFGWFLDSDSQMHRAPYLDNKHAYVV